MTTIPQRVLARYLTAAAQKTKEEAEAEEDRLQDRIGEVADALKEAEDLHAALSGDPNDELDDATKKAEAILDDLRNAESVEKESDLDLSLKSALKGAEALAEELKKAKARLKKDSDLQASFDIADDALLGVKGLIREIKSLEPEDGWAV